MHLVHKVNIKASWETPVCNLIFQSPLLAFFKMESKSCLPWSVQLPDFHDNWVTHSGIFQFSLLSHVNFCPSQQLRMSSSQLFSWLLTMRATMSFYLQPPTPNTYPITIETLAYNYRHLMSFWAELIMQLFGLIWKPGLNVDFSREACCNTILALVWLYAKFSKYLQLYFS